MPDVFARTLVNNGFVDLPYVERAHIMRTEGQHDLTMLSMRRGDIGAVDGSLAGGATSVDTDFGTARRFDFGYLDIAAPARTEGMINSTVHVLGATNVLRNSTARLWTNRLAYDIAVEVLEPYRLALEMDAYPTKIEFISQAEGESDWQLLVRLADRIGFSLVSEGVVVRLVDVAKEERRSFDLDYVSLVIPSRRSTERNVSVFKIKTTTTPANTDYKNTIIRGVDALGQSFSFSPAFLDRTATIKPEFSDLHHGTFRSLLQAEVEAERINRQGRYTNSATVVCLGYRDLRPGRCALVVDRDGEYGGFWYVTDVKHIVDVSSDKASTEATLCRDATGNRPRQYRVRTQPSKYPTARLLGGKWQTDRQWEKQLA